MAAISKELITAQDVVWGLGQVVQTRLGQQVLLDQINASHIPYNIDRSVSQELDRKLDIYAGGNVGGTVKFRSDLITYEKIYVRDGTGNYVFLDGLNSAYSMRIVGKNDSTGMEENCAITVEGKVKGTRSPSEAEDLTRKDYVDSIAIKLLDVLQSHGVITQAEKAGYVVNWNLS